MAIVLSGSIQTNRGGQPFVTVSEQDATFKAIRAVNGKPIMGSSTATGKRFYEPVAILVGGAERIATGVGAIFYEEEVTRERNRRTGRVKEIVTRIEGTGRCYVYLAEQPAAPVAAVAPATAPLLADLDEDEIAAWGDFHSAARESRREDY